MILSSYERARSPFVHVQWSINPEDKKTIEKTRIRKDDPEKEHKTELHLAKLRLKILQGDVASPSGDSASKQTAGWGWVKPWISVKYKRVDGTRTTYVRHWKNFIPYLAERKILAPAFVEREHAFDYIVWRTSQIKQKSKKHPTHNTALQELKTMARVMDEAVARGMAEKNPIRKLGIGREDSALKPEITEAQQAAIEKALKNQPEWMARSFKLAIRSGLRAHTTRLRRSQVDIASESVVIERPKGGQSRGFAIPLTTAVKETLQPWLDGTEPYFWTRPPDFNQKPRGVVWREFFDSLGLCEYCFHCARVTYISRGARAGVPQSVMMTLVNHADAEIHRIYQRFSKSDVRGWAEKIPGQAASASTQENPPT